MKKILTLFFLCFSLYGFSQTIVGIKVNPMVGFLRSSHLKKGIEDEKGMQGYNSLNYHTNIRVGLGFGGYVEHYFTGALSALFEPTINFIDCRSFINSSIDSLDATQTGTIYKVNSQADIHMAYVNLPFLAKYVFDHRNKFYAIAGPSVNFFFTPKLFSKETSVVSQYTNGILENSDITPVNNTAKLNSFSKVNVNFVVGVGKTFHLNGRGRDMNVEIRYNLPLTATTAYTTSNTFNNTALNNSIYGSAGKTAWETAMPQYKLDNFRYSSISISVGFTLFEKEK